ncbi:MAG: ATP-grasp domain-containing protein [Spirochaetaceae bacterium]|nr:MAG: ATP-grasp domain-containing protein [Spirochaetaceae bacterium]
MKRQPHLLILGAGVMQLPALRLARQQGWYVLAADADSQAPGVALADRFVHIDLRDRQALLSFARGLRRRSGLDGVFTAGTDFSTSVAWVAEGLGLPGVDYQTALNASDKQRMRTVLAAAGVPSPRFCALDDVPDGRVTQQVVAKTGIPAVVKPVDSMGARGVLRVERIEHLAAAVSEALAYSARRRVVVEQFVTGSEFSIDAVVWNGVLHMCGVADRDIRFAPYFVEVGHTMPTSVEGQALQNVVDVFTRAVAALGIRNGAAKGDVFLGPQGPIIGEIAARLSGGYMSGWTYPLASGVEPTLAAMRIALGMEPGDLEPRRQRVSVERAIISIPGIVRSISGFKRARRACYVAEVFQRCEVGHRVVFPRNNVEKCGNIICCADVHADAREAALAAVSEIEIGLEPGDPETIAFLFGNGDRAGLAAYPELMRAVIDQGRAAGRRRQSRHSGPIDAVDAAQRDWNGRSLQRTLETLDPQRCMKQTPVIKDLRPADTDRVRRLFWRALAKGGLQGGRFLLDTIKEIPTWRERLPA